MLHALGVAYETVHETVIRMLYSFSRALNDFFGKLSECLRNIGVLYEDTEDVVYEVEVYKHHHKEVVPKCNTRGFHRPIMRCARSRC